MNKADRQAWIGLVDLRPEPGNDPFDGAPGAYANVLALARSNAHYRQLVTETFTEIGLMVWELENVEPLVERRRKAETDGDVADDLLALARQLSPSSPVLYDTFYVYEQIHDA
jgi:hypothetical protein